MKVPVQLEPLFEVGVVREVIRPLMAGKEASVYLVESNQGLCVAKVYKQAHERSFRQRSAYAEGRLVRNTRQRRAMAKGSRYGKRLLEEAWQNAEVDQLFRLHAAGVRVPAPLHAAENVLLMELIADEHGDPAPRLFDVKLRKGEARALHSHLVHQVMKMLCAGTVHGDLSEYNILMAADGPVIIDLPQATDATHNRNSERLLLRDVKNLKHYLGRFDPGLKKTRFGPEMWWLFSRGELDPDTILTGRFTNKRDADTRAVLREIEAAAAEAAFKPESKYAAKKARKLAEANAERERAREQARDHATSRPEPEQGEGGPKKRRRRRRRRRPRGDGT